MNIKSLKERELYKNTEHINTQSKIVLSVIIFLIVISVAFMSLKFIFTEKRNNICSDFFNVGLIV